MIRSSVVNFVSAGMLSPKKRDHALARRQLYLNYGALSLATKLQLAGHDVALFHGEHRDPEEVFRRLRENGRFPSIYPLMVSIPSFYALPWAQAFCRLAKEVDSECRIVVGGRWVVGPDPEWLRRLLPEADVLAPGLSEGVIEQLLTESPVLKRVAEPTPGFTLNHLLVDGYRRYQPSVEASRGCGMGCVFCEERDIKVEKLGDAAALAASMALVSEQYGGEEIRPYLQSSMFMPTARWAAGLADEAARIGLDMAWRTETRVDAMTPQTLASLAGSGLRVIDLGLETASPRQILAMNKTGDPDRYLRRASELLEACRKHGVMAKVNVLLYAGETEETVAETTSWLDAHAGSIAGVSVGPVIAYGPPKTAGVLLDNWRALGAQPVDETAAVTTGITTMHLSADFPAEAAEAASQRLARRYMDDDAYFALKSFSYYPRNYGRADFDRDVAASDPSALPFTLRRRETGSLAEYDWI
ncbi:MULTISPECIES: B12-binding domain-containing radical SAM protein [unclassified Mesorhizobium]|uniref:B12-binding domain-containing radical SAM protein n=1 Tax=unclassified Mesorhizobium TaxID=325217 RepID=UPI0003CE88E3|nr:MULTISPECIES: radical SAM protein [unclassified Mesorhizobium]ESX84372.1 radical SAM protein [Mesorhizobium sp. LSHC412B00]ESY02835.1 radical SAM protein [Mesorhizobium sp. LNJC398B00]